MRDDYLWDKSGEPDPELERLERVLSPLAHRRPSPNFLDKARIFPARPQRFPGRRFIAAAAMVVMAGAITWFFRIRPGASMVVTSMQGAPLIESVAIAKTGRIGIGQSLTTDAVSRARIQVAAIGEVHVEPNTTLRLIRSKTEEHRLSLQRGTIHAYITAPPFLFLVDTPSAVAVDLGCSYTLEVDQDGAAMLRVMGGWVGFEWQGRESFIPVMGACRTRPGQGPGTPYYIDSDSDLQAAVQRYDERAAPLDLRIILDKSRPRDGLTLWHLLARTSGAGKVQVVDRLMSIVSMPEGVTREGLIAGDRQMVDRSWTALGLGDTYWWRTWKGKWPSFK